MDTGLDRCKTHVAIDSFGFGFYVGLSKPASDSVKHPLRVSQASQLVGVE